MSVDGFLMKFESCDVVNVALESARPILERFAAVDVLERAVIVTFPDGEISDQVALELDIDHSFTHITLPRIIFGPRLQEFAFTMMTECGMCYFTEILEAVYSTSDIASHVTTDLLDQTAQGLVVVRNPDEIDA